MSCENSQCVCGIVREIVAAQDEVSNNNGNGCCSTGCEESIRELLSPTVNGNNNGNDTIPFMLYCKGDCSTFIASGVRKLPLGGGASGTYFDCFETPIFKAKKFVEGDDGCCVQLELMRAVTEGGAAIDRGDEACDFFPGNSRRAIRATGVCITVDLNSFSGIACLDSCTPMSA
ncbi:CotY/CotZ family spore coat protein [Virgibacillus sp. W0181]|uniref:CotY/CotZ family spore coat protein n=1 Tax=Virgibacillus sp. W0181 TaxID=3391581 RepID=UPI003F454949